MRDYIEYLKDRWDDFDFRLFMISLLYPGKQVYVDVMEKESHEYKEVDHGKVISSVETDGGNIFSIHKDGAVLLSGSNSYDKLGA